MVAPSHLRSLQALEAALRAGSLKSAADMLSITPAAVGQRIKALEDYLGVDLVTRGRSGLAATAALSPALSHLRAAFREIEAATEALDLQRMHEIHIAAISDIVDLWLKPKLGGFREAHANIRFCINGEGDAPLRLGAVDCEIAFGPVVEGENRDLLFRDFLTPITSPENDKRTARLDPNERLEGFPLLHLDYYREDPAALDWSDWVAAHGARRTAPERGMRFQRIAAVVEALTADAGFAICGLALLREMLADGRLVAPFPSSAGAWTSHAFQARFREDGLRRGQIRKFRHWLQEQARDTAGWLEAQAKA
ncbi:LysR family transcriptional regulator [bacterium]|nr:LysR family transcriptional regulator [bacterium]